MICRYAILAALAFSGRALAGDPALKAAPGAAETLATCSNCHSTAYIVMNSVFLSADDWRAEVSKMRTVFGASIDAHTADEIAAYLGQYYGVAATR